MESEQKWFFLQNLFVENLQPLYKRSIDAENKLRSESPPGLKTFFSTSKVWIQLETQEQITKQTIICIVISVASALAVVIVLTLSIFYSLIFLFCLVSIIFIIMGILQTSGWTIGLHESVMFTIASGFCTDFFIHVISLMSRTLDLSKFGKMQKAITHYCFPVLFSVFTTIGAAVFLFPSSIPMFRKFGLFLIMSALFGYVFGFAILPGISSTFGPKTSDSLYFCCGEKVGNKPNSTDEDDPKSKKLSQKEKILQKNPQVRLMMERFHYLEKM